MNLDRILRDDQSNTLTMEEMSQDPSGLCWDNRTRNCLTARRPGQRINCINFYSCFYCCFPSFYDVYEYRAFDSPGEGEAQHFYAHDYELFYDASAKKFVESQPWSQQGPSQRYVTLAKGEAGESSSDSMPVAGADEEESSTDGPSHTRALGGATLGDSLTDDADAPFARGASFRSRPGSFVETSRAPSFVSRSGSRSGSVVRGPAVLVASQPTAQPLPSRTASTSSSAPRRMSAAVGAAPAAAILPVLSTSVEPVLRRPTGAGGVSAGAGVGVGVGGDPRRPSDVNSRPRAGSATAAGAFGAAAGVGVGVGGVLSASGGAAGFASADSFDNADTLNFRRPVTTSGASMPLSHATTASTTTAAATVSMGIPARVPYRPTASAPLSSGAEDALARRPDFGIRAAAGPKSGERCVVCNQLVFAMERLATELAVYHRNCFRCTECNTVLSLGKYAALDGRIFCKPHFKQLFALKGNYNEGFGTQPHKYKWDRTSTIESDEAAPGDSAGEQGPDSMHSIREDAASDA